MVLEPASTFSFLYFAKYLDILIFFVPLPLFHTNRIYKSLKPVIQQRKE
jgi:hypothetical protein